MSTLVTGEAVVLDLRIAHVPSRMLGALIDLAVQVIALVALTAAASPVLGGADDATAAALTVLIMVLVLIVYPTTLETLTRGRSLGKLALGLRVVRDDGAPVRFRHALTRALLAVFVDVWLTYGVAGLIAMVMSRSSKRLGDQAAGTVVVRERVPRGRAPLGGAPGLLHPAFGGRLPGWAAQLDLTALPDELALAARQLLARAPGMAPDVRHRMALQLAGDVAARVTPPPPAGIAPEDYLQIVLAERSRRELPRPPVPATYQAVPGSPPPAMFRRPDLPLAVPWPWGNQSDPGNQGNQGNQPPHPGQQAPGRTPVPPADPAPRAGGFAAPG